MQSIIIESYFHTIIIYYRLPFIPPGMAAISKASKVCIVHVYTLPHRTVSLISDPVTSWNYIFEHNSHSMH